MVLRRRDLHLKVPASSWSDTEERRKLRFRIATIARADNEVGLATIHSAMNVQGISETPGPLDSASFSAWKKTETGGGIERELRRRLRQ
jgi:hypothetical protein